MVRAVMAASCLQMKDLERIAVTIGPGTFTGVRIGLAFARGLGLALERPVSGVSTLMALAANVNDNPNRLPVAAVIDARRGGLYQQIFTPDGISLAGPKALPIALAARALPRSGVIAVGSGAALLRSASADGAPTVVLSCGPAFPDPAVVARLGAEMTPGPPPGPLYLRLPDAQPGIAQAPSGEAVIEQVGSLHAELCALLHRECFGEGWDAAAFATLASMPGALCLLAYDTMGEPAGFLLARQAADEGEILTMGTRPSHRRRGIARALLRHAGEDLRKHGVRQLHIEVNASNAAAQALYAEAGFEREGGRASYYSTAMGGREDAILMRRAL
jgi:tRNA threonylcarbamoyladenosine biosynthesis protein TsaB